jgi:GH43 family beta-xylosidase
VIFTVSPALQIYGDIWAPELHRAPNGKWYLYTSGRETETAPGPKRLFVLEAQSEDLFGEWIYKGKPAPTLWAIDPTVYTRRDGKQYACFSLIEHRDGLHNLLAICEMTDPWTFSEHYTVLARAELDWEQIPPYSGTRTLNEGPYFVEVEDRLYLVYSANGCTSEHYCMGALTYVGGDLCERSSWVKRPEPILTAGNGVYGPGHASFFRSPDGSELWCAYHGMQESPDPAKGAPRHLHLQRVGFDGNGCPYLGLPVGREAEQLPPGGEPD